MAAFQFQLSICSVQLFIQAYLILGFVYYEGDCFETGKNPYIPLDVDDPTNAQV